MLTNKVFDAFAKHFDLKPDIVISSLSEGHTLSRELEAARVEFEDALTEQLLPLEQGKQIELLTQVLALFDKHADFYRFRPLYLGGDLEDMGGPFMQWIREPNEPNDVKAFRDDFEQRLQTTPESNMDLLLARLEKPQAKQASDLVRLVIGHEPGTFDEVEKTELDDDEGRWIETGLITRIVVKAQGNVLNQLEALIGKPKAAQWLWSPDEWYDTYRESLGLPYLQRTFQNSSEAWHFYKQRLTTHSASLTPIVSPPRPNDIGELCLHSFTPKDLSALLQSMGLLDAGGNCLTNALRGKAQGPRSKFTAAYRVLQRSNLMDATANDAEWANSFKEAYSAQIGEVARSYQLTAHGRAAKQSSKAFQTGVDEATAWVNDWKEKQSKKQ